jgi:DNA polymerase III epsilon subunit-like protein
LDRPLVTFDLETTGLDVGRDRIVEIAAVKLLPNGEVGIRTGAAAEACCSSCCHLEAEAGAHTGATRNPRRLQHWQKEVPAAAGCDRDQAALCPGSCNDANNHLSWGVCP